MSTRISTAKAAYDRARYTRMRDARRAALPEDPISLLTLQERCYIAGLVDGDGTIFVMHNRKTMYPYVAVGITHRETIEWLCAKLAAPVIYRNNHTAMRQHPNHKPQYIFRMQGRRAQMLCRVLLPYLRIKRKQALLIDGYPIDARIAPGVKIAHSVIQRQRERVCAKMKMLNRRGVL